MPGMLTAPKYAEKCIPLQRETDGISVSHPASIPHHFGFLFYERHSLKLILKKAPLSRLWKQIPYWDETKANPIVFTGILADLIACMPSFIWFASAVAVRLPANIKTKPCSVRQGSPTCCCLTKASWRLRLADWFCALHVLIPGAGDIFLLNYFFLSAILSTRRQAIYEGAYFERCLCPNSGSLSSSNTCSMDRPLHVYTQIHIWLVPAFANGD